ncbi:Uncharacterized protein FWK35_00033865 [Aphis craccivora]|uniref:Uncharacterized protein n=1 Tax=Aphis craccivora TaxID=307492 RepID=A0A6G0YP21_APHCR|nr:Uncharacterized protein FWK35_00033865 [Aphis craccivora]
MLYIEVKKTLIHRINPFKVSHSRWCYHVLLPLRSDIGTTDAASSSRGQGLNLQPEKRDQKLHVLYIITIITIIIIHYHLL